MKTRNMTFMLYLTAVFSMLFMLVSNSAMASIVNTKHDFSDKASTGGDGLTKGTGQICIVCHAPHNSTTGQPPLWNHELSTVASYDVYKSPSLNAAGGSLPQPDGVSKLCLSCHDGSVAIDSFGGAAANDGNKVTGDFNLGSDLTNDHPISFTYDAALVTADPGLNSPTAADAVTIGSTTTGHKQKTGSIADTMLFDNKVQCASCHDPHNVFTQSAPFLKVDIAGSKLCLVCHAK